MFKKFKIEKVFQKGLFVLRVIEVESGDLKGSANWTESDVLGGQALTCGCLVDGRPQALWDAFDNGQVVCGDALVPYISLPNFLEKLL